MFAEVHRTGGARALSQFGQILTELHFSKSLRFSPSKAAQYAPLWDDLVASSGLAVFANATNEGHPNDRELPHELVQAGMLQGTCCRELSLISMDAVSKMRDDQSRAVRWSAPPVECVHKCQAAKRAVAKARADPKQPESPRWAVSYLQDKGIPEPSPAPRLPRALRNPTRATGAQSREPRKGMALRQYR